MTEYEGFERKQEKEERAGGTGPASYEDCESIQDPVRRTLCKACGLPVVGEAPFCKDHEPPAP